MKKIGLFFILVHLLFTNTSKAQLYFQIEKINGLETIKIGRGAELIFKAPKYSDQWQKGLIKEILYDSQSIVFDHTFLNIEEITKIKIKNPTAEGWAWVFKGFGIAYLTFGAIIDLADLTDQKALDAQNIAIGAFALGSGILLDKLAGDKIYTNNKTHRFRIIDLRYSTNE